MEAPTPPIITNKCPYCGRENIHHLVECFECGTPLVDEAAQKILEEKKKTKTRAVLWALAVGPLGLLYTSIPAGVGMFVAWIILQLLGLPEWWIPVGGRVVCACWAFLAWKDDEVENSPHHEPLRLMEEAALLENININQAIAAYEEIAQRFPNTRASKEAQRNINTLKQKPPA